MKKVKINLVFLFGWTNNMKIELIDNNSNSSNILCNNYKN